jgi:hypothetical protein
MSGIGQFETWMTRMTEKEKRNTSDIKRLQDQISTITGQKNFSKNMSTQTPVPPGSPLCMTLDIPVFKITVDNEDGTYSGIRQILSTTDADTWEDHPYDTAMYILRNMEELADGKEYSGMFKVGGYTWARFDGMVGTTPVFHIYGAGNGLSVPTNPKIIHRADVASTTAETNTWATTDDPGEYDGFKILVMVGKPIDSVTDDKVYSFACWMLYTWDGRLVSISAETRYEISTGECP